MDPDGLVDFHDSLIDAPRQKKPTRQSSKKKDPKERNICTVCRDPFTYEKFEHHKKSRKHKQALKQQKQQNKPKTPATITPYALPIEDGPDKSSSKDEIREVRYFTRSGYESLSGENKLYHYTFVALLAIERSFDSNVKDLSVSVNNSQWGEFGDVVVELTGQDGKTEIYAFQLKQVITKNEISHTALVTEKGAFSLKAQSKFLTKLREKNKSEAHFILYTLSNLSRDVLKDWKNGNREYKEIGLKLYRRKHVFNTNPDGDDMFKVELLNLDDDLLLLTNQRTREALRSSLELLITSRFDNCHEVTDDFIKFICTHFKSNDYKIGFKLTRRDILLKLGELLLTPFMLFPEVAIDQEQYDDLWKETLQQFDVTIMPHHFDIINKLYGCINANLNSKFKISLDTSVKKITISKEDVVDDALKSDLFDGFYDVGEEGVRTLTLDDLYIMLWKLNYDSLVVTTENVKDATTILKVVAFLKNSGIPLRFIITTNVKHHPHYFPEELNIFTSLEDVIEKPFFRDLILDRLTIPVLNFTISLKVLYESNEEFLKGFTPDALLNLLLNDYSFKASFNPITGDAFNNIFAVDNDVIAMVKKYFSPGFDDDNEPKNLSYEVNFKEEPEEIDIPADLFYQ